MDAVARCVVFNLWFIFQLVVTPIEHHFQRVLRVNRPKEFGIAILHLWVEVARHVFRTSYLLCEQIFRTEQSRSSRQLEGEFVLHEIALQRSPHHERREGGRKLISLQVGLWSFDFQQR